jgi:outer membrane protein assembly factor BamB
MRTIQGPSEPPACGSRRSRRALARTAALLACGALQSAQAEDWAQFQFNASRIGLDAGETAFTPDNVGALRVEFNARMGHDAANESGPIIASGRLFVGDLRGTFSAFDLAGCGARSCAPLWQGLTDGRFTSTPAASNNVVAIASDDHFLYVFPQDGCGAARCAPLWRGRLAGPSIDASVAIAESVIFVGESSGSGRDAGRLSAFALGGCGHETCDPLWTGQGSLPHEKVVGTPAVGDGFVFVQTTIDTVTSTTGRLLAFPFGGCGRPSCDPAWTARLGGPAGGTASPVVAGDKVIVGSALGPASQPGGREHLFAFAAAGCGAFVCPPVQTFETGPDAIQTAPAVSLDGTTLFTSSNQPVGPDGVGVGVLAAYDLVHCGKDCKPMWTGLDGSEGGFSPPAVAGHVVFVGRGLVRPGRLDAGVFAFDARGCGKPSCAPLVLVPSSPLATYFGAPLAVGDGKVAFVSDNDNTFSSNITVMSLP